MNLKMLCAATSLIALTLTATPAVAWDLLATRNVADRVDRDSIALEGNRRFERIRLCVYERPVHFIDVKVRFANGSVQDAPVRARIRPGQCTRALDLVGDDRNIASVDLVYEANTPRRGVGATVRLFGE
ncbi:MAG: hypothetical protein JNJ73_13695 [Hyphomonadaceae bacterium]|nr:hypothetical protein [Hyphomonadaceae bacterium]